MLANLSAIIQFLPEDLRDFSAQHPQVKTDLEERPRAGGIQGVLDGVADLGICSNDSDTKGLHAVPLTDEWSDLALIVVLRDEAGLSPVSRLLFEHLRGLGA